MAKETIKARRVTFTVDQDAFEFLAKAHAYNEDGELWIWEDSSDEFDHEREYCDDCGSYTMMEDMACPFNEGYCLDCCNCEEGFH